MTGLGTVSYTARREVPPHPGALSSMEFALLSPPSGFQASSWVVEFTSRGVVFDRCQKGWVPRPSLPLQVSAAVFASEGTFCLVSRYASGPLPNMNMSLKQAKCFGKQHLP